MADPVKVANVVNAAGLAAPANWFLPATNFNLSLVTGALIHWSLGISNCWWNEDV